MKAWLRKNSPEVAASWPEASLTAAWFDWRERVDADAVKVLEEALAHVTGKSDTRSSPSSGGGHRA